MSKKTIITLSCLCVCLSSFSQANLHYKRLKPEYSSWAKSTEVSVHTGLTAFLGDLGGTRGKGQPFSKDLNGISFRPHLGLSFSYYPQGWYKLTATANYTTITGADSVIKSKVKQSYGRYMRNLSFRSRVEELQLSGEMYPIQLINKIHRETLLKPFVGAGFGVLHFNPKAEINGGWAELQPLRLEGQGFAEYPDSKEYSLYQLYIPMTFGFKYRLDDQISVAFSTTFRKTFTDYLDDVHGKYIDPARSIRTCQKTMRHWQNSCITAA